MAIAMVPIDRPHMISYWTMTYWLCGTVVECQSLVGELSLS